MNRGMRDTDIHASAPLRRDVRVLILSSAGKDSAYAIWWAMLRGWDITGIVTVRTWSDESMMFQRSGTAMAGLQAAATGLPWLPVSQRQEDGVESLEVAIRPIIEGADWPKSKAWTKTEREAANWPVKWRWPSDLDRLRPSVPCDAIISGALRSDYQRTRLEQMAERLGVHSFSPLWHHDPEQHMRSFERHGFEVRIVSISAEGLGERWLGRRIDDSAVDDLVSLNRINGINIDGEGGEFETVVTAAPWMSRSIGIDWIADWNGQRGRIRIREAAILKN